MRAITPNGPDFYSPFGFNEDTGSTGCPWAACNGDGAGCSIDPSGNFPCSGSKNAVAPVEGGKRQVELAAIESPKNWFEDFGSAQLGGGLATVQLDPTFKQTVNANLEHHVFLTPNGDCKGLYVHQKTATSFEVRELGGGKLQREVRLSHHCSAEELREGSLRRSLSRVPRKQGWKSTPGNEIAEESVFGTSPRRLVRSFCSSPVNLFSDGPSSGFNFEAAHVII